MSQNMRSRMVIFAWAVAAFAVLFPVLHAEAAAAKCKLKLVVTQNNDVVVRGGELEYSLSVRNSGRLACKDASISMYYQSNEGFVASVPVPSAQTDYYWQIGTLAPGAVYNLAVTTRNIIGTTMNNVSNEVCASANRAADACVTTVTQLNVDPGTVSTTTPPVVKPVTKEYGTWIWDSPYAMSWTQSKQLVDAAKRYGFNAIYVTIDDYLAISKLPASLSKTQALAAYDASVEKFIAYANQQGIAVDAESGARDWAQSANRVKPYTIMDYVIGYNSLHSAKFRSIQYDVEPYLLPTYETDKSTVLTEYVDFVAELVDRNTSNIGITMVIPHFYGSSDGWTPSITFGGSTRSTFSHLLRELDKKPGNMLIEMSYRNYAQGSGGTIEISDGEMKEIGATPRPTKMIIAQETGDVDPGYVTFYGMSKAALQEQVDIINSKYAANASFGGIAVHYLDPFLVLK
jgi:hypothetical protein